MFNAILNDQFIKEFQMKLKENYEDFISKNLSEFRGLKYCAYCRDLNTTEKPCEFCGHDTMINFEDFDRETQRNIVSEELSKYA